MRHKYSHTWILNGRERIKFLNCARVIINMQHLIFAPGGNNDHDYEHHMAYHYYILHYSFAFYSYSLTPRPSSFTLWTCTSRETIIVLLVFNNDATLSPYYDYHGQYTENNGTQDGKLWNMRNLCHFSLFWALSLSPCPTCNFFQA